jgi:hypothetical protein
VLVAEPPQPVTASISAAAVTAASPRIRMSIELL